VLAADRRAGPVPLIVIPGLPAAGTWHGGLRAHSVNTW